MMSWEADWPSAFFDTLAVGTSDASVGLYRRRKYGHPEHFGSGVLVRIHDSLFLLTAAHVADDLPLSDAVNLSDVDILLGTGSIAMPFAGVVVKSILPNSRKREDDALDVAAIRIDDTNLSVDDINPLAVSELDLRDYHEESDLFMIQGFPSTKQKKLSDGSTYEAYVYRLLVLAVRKHSDSSGKYLELGFDGRATYRNGEKVTPPKFTGMSGCGVWTIGSEDKEGKRPLLLAGIVTDFYRTTKRLRSTRIWLVLSAIWNGFPELQAHLPSPTSREI